MTAPEKVSSFPLGSISAVGVPLLETPKTVKVASFSKDEWQMQEGYSSDTQSEQASTDAPQLPKPKHSAAYTQTMVDIFCALLKTNGDSCHSLSEQFLDMRDLDQKMANIFISKAEQEYSEQTRLMTIAQNIKDEQQRDEEISDTISTFSLWMGIGTTVLTGGMSICSSIAGSAVAAESALESAVIADAATASATSSATAATAEAATATAEAATAATESAGSRISNAVTTFQRTVGTKTETTLSNITKSMWQTAKTKIAVTTQHGLALVSAILVGAPQIYQGYIKIQLADQLRQLARYQEAVGMAKSSTDSCEQIVHYWSQSLERCSGMVDGAANSHKDILEGATDFIKAGRYAASLVANSRRV